MNNFTTLTVYLGSSGLARDVFQKAAAEFGALIGASGRKLVYGGMDAGLMGELAAAALKQGAHVTGIIPRRLKDIQRVMENLSETVFVEDLWDRKKRMFQKADAIIVLPGGYGTLDEAMEVLYWAKLGLHTKPLVLVNIEKYWNPIIDYLQGLPDFDPRFLIVVDRPADVFPALGKWQTPPAVPEPERYPHFEDEICRGTADSLIIDVATIENTYYAACALGLKQLLRHARPIGFLNTNSQFDTLLKWFEHASAEKFITAKCLKLYAAGDEETKLRQLLKTQAPVDIDLHKEKWGERREKPR